MDDPSGQRREIGPWPLLGRKTMCDCHDWPAPIREAIRVTEREDNTRADWEDLHDAIEQYRRRRALLHVQAHAAAKGEE
jgi:hypothetical protein